VLSVPALRWRAGAGIFVVDNKKHNREDDTIAGKGNP